MSKDLYWENFLKLNKVNNFIFLLEYPDHEKAKEGVYMTMEQSKYLAIQDSIQREKFIEQFERNVRENPEYWQKILEKSERWNEPVEEVIRKDAKWLWEVRREDREKEQQQNRN